MDGFFKLVVQRTTLKLSTDLSPEEMREAIAKAMGKSLDEIPDFDHASALSEIRKQSDRVNEIIKEHKLLFERNSKTTKDKYEELHDLGKFILALNDSLTIEVPEVLPPFPDFMLAQQQFKIGVEHTRLMSEDMKQIVKTAKYYIELANKILAEEYSHLSKTVNIFVDFNEEVIDGRSFMHKVFSLQQRELIPQIIAEYIKSELTGGSIERPGFITQVIIEPNKDSRVDFELAERYVTQDDFTELLQNCINKKEGRAIDYRSVTTFDYLWLLIVIDDVSSFSGFSIETAMIPTITKSNFDSIFIFEKFSSRIIRIYNPS